MANPRHQGGLIAEVEAEVEADRSRHRIYFENMYFLYFSPLRQR